MRALILASFLISGISNAEPIKNDVEWEDGDSGTIRGVEFRLAGVDAPETGAVNSKVDPAKCEAERSAGWAAFGYMMGLTFSGPIEFEWNGERDEDGRKVGDIKIYGQSVIQSGLSEGHLRSWDHNSSSHVKPKPDWCS